MNIFEKNKKSLEEKYFDIAQKIEKIDIEKLESRVYIEDTKEKNKVLHVIYDHRIWHMNSCWNPEIAAKIYAQRYRIRPYGIYFVFGFSDGKAVRELLKKCDDTNMIVVCEPDIELFALSIHYFDFCDLIQDKRIFLCMLELEKNPTGLLQQLVDYTKIRLMEYCILPGYDILYHERCEKFQETMLEQIQNEIIKKATYLDFDQLLPKDMFFHIKYMLKYKNLWQLRKALSVYDLRKIPVIIVSAGPSLDKNIHLLKKAQGKAYIIAVDASVRTVINSGVRPDLLCTVDPYVPERFFDGLDLKDVYWSCSQQSRPDILKKYAKHIFYHGSFGKEWNETLKNELGYEFPEFPSGGSVSTEAFSIAIYLGFRKIILIGQDLAFTDGRSHTKGIEDALGENDEYINSRTIVEVEGIDGTMLETDFQMKFYKKWLEQAIQVYQDEICVIDATEGGAKIEGTEVRNFDEVIETECKIMLDFYRIEQDIPRMFSKEQEGKLIGKMRDMRNIMSDLQETLDHVIGEQERILKMMKEKKLSIKKITELLRTVSIQEQKIEENPILDWVTMYAQKEEYEVGDFVYAEENLTSEQLIEKSAILLKAYQVGVINLQKDFDEIIMKDEETVPEYK